VKHCKDDKIETVYLRQIHYLCTTWFSSVIYVYSDMNSQMLAF
jgi:hypothetical protein